MMRRSSREGEVVVSPSLVDAGTAGIVKGAMRARVFWRLPRTFIAVIVNAAAAAIAIVIVVVIGVISVGVIAGHWAEGRGGVENHRGLKGRGLIGEHVTINMVAISNITAYHDDNCRS